MHQKGLSPIEFSLTDWLNKINHIHFKEVALGLDRIKIVAEKMNLLTFSQPIITVGGTNGKGSTVALLEAIYLAAHYRVGSFTSPFLFNINEEIKISGQPIDDKNLIKAFEKIDKARGTVSLTAFEFMTLAALDTFKTMNLDLIILEVGLGGRFDAVNIVDADLAIITSIDLDHTDLLGTTREAIANEKVGIARANRYLICGDDNPPHTLIDYAMSLPVKKMFCQGQDFLYETTEKEWHFKLKDPNTVYLSLPLTSLKLDNMANALTAISLLQNLLPVDINRIRQGLSSLHLPGRIEIRENEIYDVAHNPAAIKHLINTLEKKILIKKRYIALFSMLDDKDIESCLKLLSPIIHTFYVAPLSTKRRMNERKLIASFKKVKISQVKFFPSIEKAYLALINEQKKLKEKDIIIICGSFHTVREAEIAAKAWNARAH